MKITKKTFKINDLYSYELNKNLYFYNLNIKTICYYSNYKTFMLNKLRKNLLCEKIQILKNTKNLLLSFQHKYKNTNNNYKNTDTYKILEILKTNHIKEYNYLFNNGFLIIEEYHKIQNCKYHNNIRFIQNLKDTIKKVDKSIKKYRIESKHKNNYFKYKINSYDLLMLNKYKLTYNIQKLIYYYLIKLKKSNINYKSLQALKNPIFQKLINDYTSNLAIIQKDFIDIIKNDLKSYTHKFLYKTI